MVSSTGMTCPIWAWVASLYWRQNSMMFTPCWPRAVPTGGAGVACPARIWSLTMAETFLRLRPAGVPFGIDLHLLRFQRPLRTSRSVGFEVRLSPPGRRSEEHTSELQSHHDLVCRLLLEKK